MGVKHTNKNIYFEDDVWWYAGAKSRREGERQTLESHIKKNKTRMFVNGKYVPKSHPLHKAGRFKTFEGAAFSSLKGYEKTPEGHVYIISNPCWEGWIKVGMAIDAEDRCNQYQTSSPFRDYKLCHTKYFEDRKSAEHLVHKKLKRLSTKHKGEWFKVSVDEATKLIEAI
jgi:hypothetical protein